MKDLSRETRLLLERGRGQTLEPEHRARLKRSVLAGAVGVSAAATTLTAGWTATAAKLAAVLLFVGGATALVGGVGTGTRGTPTHAPVTESPPVHVAAPPKTAPEPVSPPAARVDPPVPAPTGGSGSTRAKTRAPVTQAKEGPVTSSLQEEALLVREANAGLESGDAERALVLAEEHARRFPHGALLPEGSAVHILALCQAGRLDQARTETGAFLSAHPEGPLSMRVRSSCGGGSQ